MLGYLYNVHLRSTAEHRTAPVGHSTAVMHRQLEVLLSGIAACNNGTDTRLQNKVITINGISKIVDIMCHVNYIILDAAEGDIICCRQGTHHPSSLRHCRTCDCAYANLDDPFYDGCSKLKSSEVEAMVADNDTDGLKAITQHNVSNAFCTVMMCDTVHGIFGSTPGDLLHMFQLGIVKYCLLLFMKALPDGIKLKLDQLARAYVATLRSSHAHTFFRTSVTRGISNVSQLSGTEHIGLLHLLCALIQLGDAWELLDGPLRKKDLYLTDILELFEFLLCFFAWTKKATFWSRNDTDAQDQAKHSIKLMLSLVIHALPRRFGNGWALSKVHEHNHIVDDITRWGATENYNASYGETNHKTHAKIPGKRALRRVQTFDHSIANRVTDTYCLRKFRELCRTSQKQLKHGTYMELVNDLESDTDSASGSDDDRNDDDDDSEDDAAPQYHALGLPDPRVAYATRYTIVCTPFRNNDREPYRYNTVCTWYTRSKGLCRLAPGLIQFLVSHFRLAQGNKVRTLHGFTQYKHNGHQYRCHPNYRSENRGWYDWAFMRYETAGGNESMLPVRFQTFIKDALQTFVAVLHIFFLRLCCHFRKLWICCTNLCQTIADTKFINDISLARFLDFFLCQYPCILDFVFRRFLITIGLIIGLVRVCGGVA